MNSCIKVISTESVPSVCSGNDSGSSYYDLFYLYDTLQNTYPYISSLDLSSVRSY